MTMKITWLGHSAFALDIDGHSVLIDPFLTGNPLASIPVDQVTPELILLSHGHNDHMGDTIAIAKRTGATVIANFEIGEWLEKQDVAVWLGNPGGTYRGEFVQVKLTPAFHSSSLPDGSYGGQPNGLIIRGGGGTVYFAGDTSLFGDMRLIGEEGIDVAILPIGDTFTMGLADSVRAIRFLEPRYAIPMHYDTFPAIVQNAATWADMVNRDTVAQPIVLDPGGAFTLD
jgi:L-ascorbate metabolism protein UlaG (beta-lactamase superfamily)